MKKTNERTYKHKGWTIYKAGPLPGLPKKYVFYPPDGFPGERYERPSLKGAVGLINGMLAAEAFNARLRWEAEWIEIEE